MARKNPRRLASGRWQADWRDASGVRHRPTFRTQAAAQKALRDAQDARDRREVRSPVPTLEQFVPQAVAAIRPRVAGSTWKTYRRHLDLHLLPRVGPVPLDGFTPRVLQELFAGMQADGMSPAMVHRVYATLSVVLMLGARYELCPLPSKKILSLPRRDRYIPKVPTVPMIERLVAGIRQDYSALMSLCGYAGLRWGEAAALHPRDIDWAAWEIHVDHGIDRDTGVRQPPKANKSRVVTMIDPVAEALRAHIEEGYSTREWVFHREGGPIVPHGWFDKQIWVPARAAAGVDFRFHDLRHAAGTVMAEIGGWGPKRVMTELGHHDEAFFLRVYGHLWDEDASQARIRLSDALTAAIGEAKARASSRAL